MPSRCLAPGSSRSCRISAVPPGCAPRTAARRAESLPTDEEADRVFDRALADFRDMTSVADATGAPRAGSAAECDAVMARLREAAAE